VRRNDLINKGLKSPSHPFRSPFIPFLLGLFVRNKDLMNKGLRPYDMDGERHLLYGEK
jgi:hypothetical protein